MAGKIVINADRCKGCGLCILVCPKKTIVISNNPNRGGYLPAKMEGSGCTGCSVCAIICPDTAIEVYRDAGGVIVGVKKRQGKIVKGKL